MLYQSIPRTGTVRHEFRILIERHLVRVDQQLLTWGQAVGLDSRGYGQGRLINYKSAFDLMSQKVGPVGC
ncbi:hypothetical protein Bpfe_011055 [Biomphalaria pfeifferi]|uniref:Uncharacterized protein n=1 Tax=Biomphalaria pfeifferi TaxID=112525 RepID=A0AAD8BRM7_BIOPF|nr:hypothetical protein Bpfe_011055 [Biomphalaria pfeifferi]